MQKLPIAALLIALLGILHTHAPALAENPKIGVISGLSGAGAKWSRYQNKGIQLAQEELKAEGFPVEVIYEDSATKAPQAISAYNKLVSFDKVDALIANDLGFVIAPLIPIVNRDKRLLFAISIPNQNYCKQSRGYYFSGTSQIARTKAGFELFLKKNPGIRKIGIIIHDDPDWGNAYADVWKSLAKSLGIEVVHTFRSLDFPPDYRTALTAMLPKKPDAIFLAHESQSFLKVAHELSYNGSIVSTNQVLENLVDPSPGTLSHLESVFFVDIKISPDFRERFNARFGEAPILEAYAGYEALRSVAKALKKNRAEPAVGLRHVSYEGVGGTVDFTGPSCAGNQAEGALYRFEAGRIVEVEQ